MKNKLLITMYSLITAGFFFGSFPPLAFIIFDINFFMDEFMRMSMISFFFLGSAMTLGLMVLYFNKFLEKNNVEIKLE